MYLTEYQPITVDNFMGLWNRGSLDDVPPDHASDIRNMAFARKRETVTRGGTAFSHAVPSGGKIVRQFDATFNNGSTPGIPLVCDGAGNIWRLDNYTVLLNIPGMIDFDALNMNNHVYIAPMLDGPHFDPVNGNVLYVWVNPNDPTARRAAGVRPAKPSVISAGTGHVGPGEYGAAFSFEFDTGYVSPPSDVATINMPGGTQMQIELPATYPPGVKNYIIFVTKAQPANNATLAAEAALYQVDVVPAGTTYDNLNFYDTDLIILASDFPVNGNIFNSMPILPAGSGYGSVALIKYHNRLIIIGPNITYDPSTANASVIYDGRIFVSTPGAPENFDVLTGFLLVNSEFDGNILRTGFELFGVLYLCKAVGTFSTQDTGYAPSDPSNPWIVNIIDGGIGAYHHAVGTITASQPALSFNSTAFLANRGGLFLFNGNVLRPELTWKIRNIWSQMTINVEYQIRVTVDIFNDILYVMIPTNDPVLGPLLILMGDYSLGLDSNNIRWSIYTFPWPVYDIVMCSYPDPVGTSFYYLRLGSNGIMYKLDGSTPYDQVWYVSANGSGQLLRNVSIDNYYQLAPLVTGAQGSLNITRFVRYRMAGSGVLYTTLQDQGEYVSSIPGSQLQQITNVSPDPFPGNFRDIGIQTNFTNEKVILKFEMNSLNDFVRMARVDIFGKSRWPTRPNG